MDFFVKKESKNKNEIKKKIKLALQSKLWISNYDSLNLYSDYLNKVFNIAITWVFMFNNCYSTSAKSLIPLP